MRHGRFGKKLNRTSGERIALRRTLITQLLLNERIETTRAKAESMRAAAEHMITQVKRSLQHEDPARQIHIRRLLNGRLSDNNATEKIFFELAPRYATRPGGYTRMYKLVPRKGDRSEMVLLELVDRPTGEDIAASTDTNQPGVGGRARELLNRLRGRGANAATTTETPAPAADQPSESSGT